MSVGTILISIENNNTSIAIINDAAQKDCVVLFSKFLLVILIIKFVVYFYPFNISSIYIFYCRFWPSISRCLKNKFIRSWFFQSVNVSVKELCIVGYFDYVKATAHYNGDVLLSK